MNFIYNRCDESGEIDRLLISEWSGSWLHHQMGVLGVATGVYGSVSQPLVIRNPREIIQENR